jgi:aspartyl-tRNA(Asn)/glutamyl-tRNA(Gln) amidotransferase subunit B
MTETLLDAEVENDRISYLPLIEMNMGQDKFAKQLANWFVNIEVPYRRETSEVSALKDVQRAELYQAVYDLVSANKLSSTNAKQLILDVLAMDELPESVESYATEKGYAQVSDEGEIAKIVSQVVDENAKAAEDVRNGEMKAIGFLVGQVMKLSKGKANPQMAQELIKKHLGL